MATKVITILHKEKMVGNICDVSTFQRNNINRDCAGASNYRSFIQKGLIIEEHLSDKLGGFNRWVRGYAGLG